MSAAPAPVIHQFGEEAEPVVVLDGFASNPDGLRAAAAGKAFSRRGPHYPGIRAACDPSYLAERMDVLEQVLREVFGIARGAQMVEAAFSLVTTAPDALSPIQRIPHFDSTDPGRVALLHYLCGPEQGGTAFYRHRASGYETITPARLPAYDAALRKEAAALPTCGYVTGTTDLFEQIGAVEAAWNRMVLYRGRRLHSGIIPPDLPLSADPASGRLTVNIFLQAR